MMVSLAPVWVCKYEGYDDDVTQRRDIKFDTERENYDGETDLNRWKPLGVNLAIAKKKKLGA